MDEQLLTASNSTPTTSINAPGESVPAWLYRRTLYHLAAERRPTAREIRRIRTTVLDHTAIRIPQALLQAIVVTYENMNDSVRNRIHNFTNGQMQPGPGDFQIQPVSTLRPEPLATGMLTGPATTTASRPAQPFITGTGSSTAPSRREARDATEIARLAGQVPERSPSTDGAEFTANAGPTNTDHDSPEQTQTNVSPRQRTERNLKTEPAAQGSAQRRPQHAPVSHVRTTRSGETNEVTPPTAPFVDANATRRARYPGENILSGLEKPAPPTTGADRVTQGKFTLALQAIDAASIIGPLQGDHVRPTDSYFSSTETHILVQDERGTISHVPRDELQNQQFFQAPDRPPWSTQNKPPAAPANARRPGRNVPVTTATANTAQNPPLRRAPARTRARATRNTRPAEGTQRETRAAAKRKRENTPANDTQGNGEQPENSDNKSDEQSPTTKKPRITLNIDLETGKITRGAGTPYEGYPASAKGFYQVPPRKENTQANTGAQQNNGKTVPETRKSLIVTLKIPKTTRTEPAPARRTGTRNQAKKAKQDDATAKSRKRGREEDEQEDEDEGKAEEKDDLKGKPKVKWGRKK